MWWFSDRYSRVLQIFFYIPWFSASLNKFQILRTTDWKCSYFILAVKETEINVNLAPCGRYSSRIFIRIPFKTFPIKNYSHHSWFMQKQFILREILNLLRTFLIKQFSPFSSFVHFVDLTFFLFRAFSHFFLFPFFFLLYDEG